MPRGRLVPVQRLPLDVDLIPCVSDAPADDFPLSGADVADLFGVDRATFARWERRGWLRAVRRQSDVRRARHHILRQWVRHEQTHTCDNEDGGWPDAESRNDPR